MADQMTGEEMYMQFQDYARKEAGLTEKNIEVGEFNICYQEGGKGETVLLLHGFSGFKENWSLFAKHLSTKYHIVAIDLPGHGKSSKIESESYDLENQVKRLDQFIQKVGLKRFHLAGNSMGGTISGKYTVTYPDKILSLGLFDTGGILSAKQSEVFELVMKGDNVLLIKSAEDFDRFQEFVFVEPIQIPEPMKEYMVKISIENKDFNEKIAQDFFSGLYTSELYSLEADLPKIKTRTFILWGDKDRLVDVSSVEILEKGLSDCEAVIMKDCGHCPMLERPEEAATHYLKFLESI